MVIQVVGGDVQGLQRTTSGERLQQADYGRGGGARHRRGRAMRDLQSADVLAGDDSRAQSLEHLASKTVPAQVEVLQKAVLKDFQDALPREAVVRRAPADAHAGVGEQHGVEGSVVPDRPAKGEVMLRRQRHMAEVELPQAVKAMGGVGQGLHDGAHRAPQPATALRLAAAPLGRRAHAHALADAGAVPQVENAQAGAGGAGHQGLHELDEHLLRHGHVAVQIHLLDADGLHHVDDNAQVRIAEHLVLRSQL
mmetsp:Transcript_32342/g.94634  ORF Transcript_32342/g.94634 Transcript_32342/m.94634 type:complete len:252 (+) Transcript_32342:2306-3061(+)